MTIEDSVLEQNSERINPFHDKVQHLPMLQSLDDYESPDAKSELIDLPEIIVSSNENIQPMKDIRIDDSAISLQNSQLEVKLGLQNYSLDDEGELSVRIPEKTIIGKDNLEISASRSPSNGKQLVLETHELEAILEEFSGSWEEIKSKGENAEESTANNGASASYREDSSLTASSSLSESKTYAGLTACAGNLSLRSDSTTSARSFAFPVLQSEWNSSPVRLGKAERMHRRMLRRWRETLLCCKF